MTPDAVAGVAHPGLLRDVGESSVAVVAVEAIGEILRRVPPFGLGIVDSRYVGAVYQVDVEISVLVEVQEGAAGTRGLEDRAHLLVAEAVEEVDTGLLGDVA